MLTELRGHIEKRFEDALANNSPFPHMIVPNFSRLRCTEKYSLSPS